MTVTGGRVREQAPAAVPRAPSGAWPRAGGAAGAVGAVVGAGLFLLAHRALVDDAYITLGYARNLAERGQWALVAGMPANTQTSPLNALLLAAGVAVLGAPIVAVGAVLVASLAASGAAVAALAGRVDVPPVRAAAGAVLLLATVPALAGTVGLETYLGAAVLLVLASAALAGRVTTTGVLVGVAVLVRPDLTVPAVVLAVGLLAVAGRGWRAAVRAVALGAVVALPWHLMAWRVLGGLVPDTFALKTDRPGMTVLTAPGFYLFGPPDAVQGYPWPTVLTLLVVAAGTGAALLGLRRHGRLDVAAAVLAAAGWAHWAALLAIGSYAQLWYYAPVVAMTVAALALHLASSRRAGPVVVVGLAVAGVVLAGPWPWERPPLMTNFATVAEYSRVGTEVGRLTGGEAVEGPGEIGQLAFFAGVPVHDFLSDRALTRPLLDRRHHDAGSRLGQWLLELNWRYRPETPRTPLRWALVYERYPDRPAGAVVASWPMSCPMRGPDRVLLIDRGAPAPPVS